MAGADMFLGLSAAGILTKDMVKQMAENPIILLWQTQIQKFCLNTHMKYVLMSLWQLVVRTTRTK